MHDGLKNSPPSWTNEHRKIVQQIRKLIILLPCLHLVNPNAPKIVEIDASDIGYKGILKHAKNKKGTNCSIYFKHWN